VYAKHWPAHSPRKGFFFFLDEKEAKNQVGKKASSPHQAFTPQTGQNHGLESFALLRSLLPLASAKFPMPLPHTSHHRSSRFRPKLFCRREGKGVL
jgi:hypothetical protein